MDPRPPIKILADQLAAATLRNVVEEFVTRDGTEATDAETKIRSVLELLRSGAVELWFDATTGTCNILPA